MQVVEVAESCRSGRCVRTVAGMSIFSCLGLTEHSHVIILPASIFPQAEKVFFYNAYSIYFLSSGNHDSLILKTLMSKEATSRSSFSDGEVRRLLMGTGYDRQRCADNKPIIVFMYDWMC